jgi:plasmid stability protein
MVASLGGMGTFVQIRNVPEETRRALKARAAARGESLNTYLLHLLEHDVSRPSVVEVLERAARRTERAEASAADILRASRTDRGDELDRRVGP